jgi:hypothetical protein
MSGSDLIVEAPWIIFGAAVLAICIRLLRSRPARRQPEPAPLPSSDLDGSGGAARGQCGPGSHCPGRAGPQAHEPGRHETASPGPVPRGSRPLQPLTRSAPGSAGQETISGPGTREA